MAIIAFDVDGTLETYNEKPRWNVIDLLRCFHALGHRIIVWSGGGKSYAEQKVRELNLEEFVDTCYDKPCPLSESGAVDICFDDELVSLADVNIKV